MASFRRPINYILFLSSYVPLFVLIAIRIHELPIIKKVDVFGTSIPITYTGLIILGCVILGILLVISIKRVSSRGTSHKRVEKIRLRNERLASYLLVYVFVFAGLSFTVIEDMIIFLLFFFLLFAIEIRSELLYTNPLLAIWGYQLYEVTLPEREVLVLSKSELQKNLIRKEDNEETSKELKLVPMGRSTFIEPKDE